MAQLGRQICQIYSQGNSLLIIYVTEWFEPRATDCRQKEEFIWKFPRPLTGMETRNLSSCEAVPPFSGPTFTKTFTTQELFVVISVLNFICPIQSVNFTKISLKKLTLTERDYGKMSYSVFYTDRSRSAKSTLSKAWLLLGRFLRNWHKLINLL